MLPSDTGDCGTSTRFSLTPSDGSAELNHWTEAWGGVRVGVEVDMRVRVGDGVRG